MRFATVAWLALVVAGCGQVTSPGTDSSVGGSDIDADTVEPDPDAGQPDATPPLCLWSELTRDDFVNLNGTDFERSPSFTTDGLAIFYTSAPQSGEYPADVFDAVREERGLPFGAPRLVGEVSAPEGEYDVEIAAAADEIYLLRDSGPAILASARVKGGAFGEPVDTGLVGTSPTLSGDGLDLYFLDPAKSTIQRSSRAALGEPWGPAEPVGQSGSYTWIDVTADELRLLLSGGAGGVDTPAIAIAERASVDEPFGEPAAAGDALVGGGASIVGEASWDGRGAQLVVAVELEDGNSDLYFSACE